MTDFKVEVMWEEKNPYPDTDQRYFTWRPVDAGRKVFLFPQDAPAIQALRDAGKPWGVAAALIPKEEVKRLALACAGYERGLCEGKNYGIEVSDESVFGRFISVRKWRSWN